ncbi:uncharacterized protein L969DRAFT_19513 [Mixia osmundae IAM 14324]|uniref:RlpA-like protein double-psi beta-barrel domain-containing protein n=1 Tax=Mixia osmundae (strain CBS 9802 / IAM 14324 / JCM 22182 / KY 12970) TaxID=764103 RepID=G7DUR3_MIXOS|nr:uncharacterized protein L969DRAFT_19513 [Mixia osmundae IAM 14324]KEI37461.1 hypothetical protein L969DRAFT_19513 [Mixia osmundae IAM 14324]GAA94323.1 hypothetical protein E5Q_00973 [Mixia osmundae IAM 14324]
MVARLSLAAVLTVLFLCTSASAGWRADRRHRHQGDIDRSHRQLSKSGHLRRDLSSEFGTNPFGDHPQGLNEFGSDPEGTSAFGSCPLGQANGCTPAGTGSAPAVPPEHQPAYQSDEAVQKSAQPEQEQIMKPEKLAYKPPAPSSYNENTYKPKPVVVTTPPRPSNDQNPAVQHDSNLAAGSPQEQSYRKPDVSEQELPELLKGNLDSVTGEEKNVVLSQPSKSPTTSPTTPPATKPPIVTPPVEQKPPADPPKQPSADESSYQAVAPVTTAWKQPQTYTPVWTPPSESTTLSQSVAPFSPIYTGGTATFYDPSTGVSKCGPQYTAQSNVVALQAANFDMRKCGKSIIITNHATGRTVVGIAGDLCAGCYAQSLDLSPTLFESTGSAQSVGRVPISWRWAN